MKILLLIIILLLWQIIINQQELDYHVIEQTRGNLLFDISKDGIMYRGFVNRIIWFFRQLYHVILKGK